MTKYAPGLAVCALATVVAMTIAHFVPLASALLIAIVLGILLRNLKPVQPASWVPGMQLSAKQFLRIGIVFLGAQLVLGDIAALGWKMLIVVIAVVTITLFATVGLGRVIGVNKDLTLLIASGFSICGAAAIAGVESTIRSRKEDVAAAVALVVLFGTLMIGAVPVASELLGLSTVTAGLWAGASTHEVAQVVAIGGILGPEALKVAVIVKLARVLMLAPVVAVFAILVRRKLSAEAAATTHVSRPPIVPVFVIGFVAAAVLRTLGWLPGWAVSGASIAQTVCLTASMFALGNGVHISSLLRLGLKPVLLAVLSTLVVATVAGVGVWLA